MLLSSYSRILVSKACAGQPTCCQPHGGQNSFETYSGVINVTCCCIGAAALEVRRVLGRQGLCSRWLLQARAAPSFMACRCWLEEFQHIGLGQWFRYFTGALELLGAFLILAPSLAAFGALLLICIMIGASGDPSVRDRRLAGARAGADGAERDRRLCRKRNQMAFFARLCEAAAMRLSRRELTECRGAHPRFRGAADRDPVADRV